jgi:hypothetical protein
MTSHPEPHPDNDLQKGATEDDSPHIHGEEAAAHTYMRDQIGHRNADDMFKENDSDYPEPGSNPEHSGQHK